MDIKLESEDANFAFPELAQGSTPENKISARNAANGIGTSISRTGNGAGTIGRIVGITRPRPAMGVLTKRAPITHQGPVTLSSQFCMYHFTIHLLSGYIQVCTKYFFF